MVTSILTDLQAAAVAALASNDIFNGTVSENHLAIPIITETKGEILQEIELCLAQVGIAALIVTPVFEFHQHLAQDLSGWAYINVTLYEDVPVNTGSTGTKIPIAMLAEAVVCILHWLPHGCNTALVNSTPRFLAVPRPIEFQSAGPPLQFNVSFQAHVTLNPSYP